MKRAATTLLGMFVVLAASATFANAALRVPQIPVVGGGLQAYFNSISETINVNTDQDAIQTWTHTVSNNTTYTIEFQSSPNANIQQFGMYNGGAVVPGLFFLMSGSVGPLGFSTASFGPGNTLIVNRFDSNANFLSSTTFGGIDPTNFGFYMSTNTGTVFTQDFRNPGGLARALSFTGNGANAGQWFLCWDELEPGCGACDAAASTASSVGDQDFDDLVIMMESVSPTPVSNTSWGALKRRFR